jgi:rubrerythrin
MLPNGATPITPATSGRGVLDFEAALKRTIDMRGDPNAPRVTQHVADSVASDLEVAAEAFKASTQLVTAYLVAGKTLDLVKAEEKALQARLDSIDKLAEALMKNFTEATEIYKVVGHEVDKETSTKLMHELAQVRRGVETDMHDAVSRETILRDKLTPAREIISAAAKRFTGSEEEITAMHCPVCYESTVDMAWKCGHTACERCVGRMTDKKCSVCRVPGEPFRLFFMCDTGVAQPGGGGAVPFVVDDLAGIVA